MPRARTATTTAVKAGVRRRMRTPYRRSERKADMGFLFTARDVRLDVLAPLGCTRRSLMPGWERSQFGALRDGIHGLFEVGFGIAAGAAKFGIGAAPGAFEGG